MGSFNEKKVQSVKIDIMRWHDCFGAILYMVYIILMGVTSGG